MDNTTTSTSITTDLPVNVSAVADSNVSPSGCLCASDGIDSVVTTTPPSLYDVSTASLVFYPWANPDNLISLQTLLFLEKLVTCGLNPILLVVGLPGNVINCVVFKRQGLGDRMNVSLFSLAAVDGAVVCLWFLLGSFCLLPHLNPALPASTVTWWKWTVRKYLRGVHRGFYFSSGCLTMLIAVERYLCVAMPLRAPDLLATATMATVILFVVLALQLLCLIYPFKFDVTSVVDEVTGKTVVTTPSSQRYLDYKGLIDVLENTVIMGIIPLVTFVVVSVATLLTVIHLKRVIVWREEVAAVNSGRKSQIRLVKMLVVVSCIYMVTATPNIVFGVIRYVIPDFYLTGKYRNFFVLCHLLYLLLGTVNSSVNFFVYLSRSSRFRAELTTMLPACLLPKTWTQRKDARGITSVSTTDVSSPTAASSVPDVSCLPNNVTISSSRVSSATDVSCLSNVIGEGTGLPSGDVVSL